MYKLDKLYYQGHSKYCEIIMGYNNTFGKVLFLDRELQSSSYDEKIYHEFLVHPVMRTVAHMHNLEVLVIGGGEGATVREVLKWKNVKHIDWVDLDIELVELCKKHMNYCDDSVYSNEKVTYIPDDIMHYLYVSNKKYDVVIVDLPDPDCEESGDGLYSSNFWSMVLNNMKDHAVVSSHTGPILYGNNKENREGLVYVKDQTRKVGFNEGSIYHVYIPSFQSEWSFWMSSVPNKTNSFPTECTIYDNENQDYAFYWPSYFFSEEINNKE
jgi:spermidine synthase